MLLQQVLLVAETLGKYVDEILDEMSLDELGLWIAWFEIKRKEEEKLLKKAGKGSSGKKVLKRI